ncbi:hypothetical protein Tco_0020538 [Tanacetum coccineum]
MLDYGFNFMNTKIHIDNESTICIVKNPAKQLFLPKTKHIEIKDHFIRDSFDKRLIQVIKIHTDHNVADLLTKAFDVSSISDEFGVKIGGCKVNAARNLDTNTKKFLMYPRFLQLFFNNQITLAEPFNDVYQTPAHTKKVFTNMKRKGKDFSGRVTPLFASMLAPPVVEGEGSGQPSEPQPAPSTAQPRIEEQIPVTESSSPQNTQSPRQALQEDTQFPQTSVPIPNVADEAVFKEWDDRVVRATTTAASLDAAQASGNISKTQSTAMSNDPLSQEISSGGNTPRSDEERIEQDDLTDFVPPTPYDSPLSGGHTPGSDEGRPNINELMAICTNLSNRVLALEQSKTAQDLVIRKLKKKVKKLEKKLRARTPGMKLFKIGVLHYNSKVIPQGNIIQKSKQPSIKQYKCQNKNQDKYVADILKKFNFATVKTTSTPIETNKALLKDEEAEDVDVHLYRSMIGSLMYLTASRPDIMFVVCACARFQVTPKVSHLHVVKRIFRYLKGQPKLGLWYPRDSPFDLEAFSESDYAGASLDRKSTTGGCQFLGKRLISWQCKKQTIVANSTTEAEYVAAANCYFWKKLRVYAGKDLILLGEKLVQLGKKLVLLVKVSTAKLPLEFVRVTTIEDSQTVNNVKQIHATVDGKTVITLTEPFNDVYQTPAHTKKVFTNMKRKGKDFSGRVTPLFASMLAPPVVEGEGSGQPSEPQPAPSTAQPRIKEQIPVTESSSP